MSIAKLYTKNTTGEKKAFGILVIPLNQAKIYPTSIMAQHPMSLDFKPGSIHSLRWKDHMIH